MLTTLMDGSSVSRTFDRALAMRPAGAATTPNPIKRMIKVKILPPRVVGYTSP